MDMLISVGVELSVVTCWFTVWTIEDVVDQHFQKIPFDHNGKMKENWLAPLMSLVNIKQV